MKLVYDSDNNLIGTFQSVELVAQQNLPEQGLVIGARLVCDLCELPISVIGSNYRVEDGDPPAASYPDYASHIEDLLDQELDGIAQSWGYKSGTRLASYANSTNAKWKAEAEAFIAGRDAWWGAAAALYSAWTPGDPVPTYETVRAQMPPIVRPS